MNAHTLEPVFGNDSHPVSARRMEEHAELTRQAAQRVVDSTDAGRPVDPYSVAWARQVVAKTKPLTPNVAIEAGPAA